MVKRHVNDSFGNISTRLVGTGTGIGLTASMYATDYMLTQRKWWLSLVTNASFIQDEIWWETICTDVSYLIGSDKCKCILLLFYFMNTFPMNVVINANIISKTGFRWIPLQHHNWFVSIFQLGNPVSIILKT